MANISIAPSSLTYRNSLMSNVQKLLGLCKKYLQLIVSMFVHAITIAGSFAPYVCTNLCILVKLPVKYYWNLKKLRCFFIIAKLSSGANLDIYLRWEALSPIMQIEIYF